MEIIFKSINQNYMQTFPESWNPSKVDIKAGWKNRSAILSEITTCVNDEIFIEDENEFMEKIDIVLEWMKARYKIEKTSSNEQQY